MIKIVPLRNRRPMDITALIASCQLGIAILQLKLDHFSKPTRDVEPEALDQFYVLGEAIRSLEYALAETVAFVSHNNGRTSNPKLATIWRDTSQLLRSIEGGADYAQLTFEKQLYWENPNFYARADERKLYYISLDNVLIQLRKLRSNYEKLQNKIYH